MIFNSTLEILNLKYLLWIIWKMIWSLRRDRLCFAMPSLISNTKLIHHLNHPIQQNEVCTNFMLIMHVELWLHNTLSSPSLLEKLINQYLITCTKFALVFYMQKNRRNDANYSGYWTLYLNQPVQPLVIKSFHQIELPL